MYSTAPVSPTVSLLGGRHADVTCCLPAWNAPYDMTHSGAVHMYSTAPVSPTVSLLGGRHADVTCCLPAWNAPYDGGARGYGCVEYAPSAASAGLVWLYGDVKPGAAAPGATPGAPVHTAQGGSNHCLTL
jgi:hypothetical protein